jgi:hypothetical protein
VGVLYACKGAYTLFTVHREREIKTEREMKRGRDKERERERKRERESIYF